MSEELYTALKKFLGINIEVICSSIGVRNIHINKKQTSEKNLYLNNVSINDDKLFNVFTQLEEYFNRTRKGFDLPLELLGTEFQKKVWNELIKIPYGETISYGELANRMGDKNLMRAVASANGANPIPIIIPCHRVIGANGSLTGYGGGLDVKQKLLELEGSWSLDLFT
ncbi:MAG: methylated-DNA--[protein]-cysteine S-methyltransferase [Ignavibacteriaceae bacterium]|nr:methylated-DNA--[protein]-cysteine S-methyltransferase [Ignavibacteriaceae bacterium]